MSAAMSVNQSRKDRERPGREELIIDHAQRLLARDGFQDLNLDEVARAVEYSKGTLYLHFESKEDLVLAVATRALRQRADLFERAATFQGTVAGAYSGDWFCLLPVRGDAPGLFLRGDDAEVPFLLGKGVGGAAGASMGCRRAGCSTPPPRSWWRRRPSGICRGSTGRRM
jgi:AcrR family transcriptional regulator